MKLNLVSSINSSKLWWWNTWNIMKSSIWFYANLNYFELRSFKISLKKFHTLVYTVTGIFRLIKNLFRANIESGLNTPDTSLSLPQGVLHFLCACASPLECLVWLIFLLRKYHSLKPDNSFFFSTWSTNGQTYQWSLKPEMKPERTHYTVLLLHCINTFTVTLKGRHIEKTAQHWG